MIEIDVTLQREDNLVERIEQFVNPPKPQPNKRKPPKIKSLHYLTHNNLGQVLTHHKFHTKTYIQHVSSAGQCSKFLVLNCINGSEPTTDRYKSESWLAAHFADRLQYHMFSEISEISMRPSFWLAEYLWSKNLSRDSVGSTLEKQEVYPFIIRGDTSQYKLGDECFNNDYRMRFILNKKLFQSVTHYLAYEKAKLLISPMEAERILRVTDFTAMKHEEESLEASNHQSWLDVERNYARKAIYCKFTFNENRELKKHLLSTGDKVIVAAGLRDSYWGIGVSKKLARKVSTSEWKGENVLGFLLTEIRSEIKQTSA